MYICLFLEINSDGEPLLPKDAIFTPLHCACKYGKIAIVKLLLENNGHLDEKGKRNSKLLNWIIDMCVFERYWEEKIPMMRLLCAKGICWQVMKEKGKTLFDWLLENDELAELTNDEDSRLFENNRESQETLLKAFKNKS